MKHDDPAASRPTPGPDLETTLLREVNRCQHRLDQALEDLRRYRLSADHERPASVYEKRGPIEFHTGNAWRGDIEWTVHY